jgi:MYXO-CTERM domain-containing protein
MIPELVENLQSVEHAQVEQVETLRSGVLPSTRCITMDLLPSSPPMRPSASSGGPGALMLGGSLPDRDPFGVPNELASTHFVMRWGTQGNISQGDAQDLLDAFETAWSVEVVDMDHPAPAGTDEFLFNVYIGDTGSGAPSAYGAGGYFYTDSQGYPYIVVSKDVLFDTDYAAGVAYHEFYHAIQGGTNRFDYNEGNDAAWFWEATAEWVTFEVDLDNPYNGTFLYSYLLLPDLPVDYFDYPDSGIMQEYHQYGAFLFPHYLSGVFGPEIIRDAWAVPGNERSPLEVMRNWLDDQGEDLDEQWLDHLARNPVYDYPTGENFRLWTEYLAGYYPDTDTVLARVSGAGGEDDVAGNNAPMRYGRATILLDNPDNGELTARVEGEEQGTDGSPAEFGARLTVVEQDGSFTYHEVPFEGTTGETRIDVNGAKEIYLSVGAWTEDLSLSDWESERFRFSWSLDIGPPEETGDDDDDDDTTGDDDDDDEGDDDDDGGGKGGKGGKGQDDLTLPCGCAAGSAAGTSGPGGLLTGLLALLGLGLRARRR